MGLASNNDRQQREADMHMGFALDSITLLSKVRDSARARRRTAVATYENPPPCQDERVLSAHELEEVATFMRDPEAETADFNSCVYGPPIGSRRGGLASSRGWRGSPARAPALRRT